MTGDYVKFMDNLFDKNYAKKIPAGQPPPDRGKVWYLPHHGVYHPIKPEKIRVVFDCSAQYGGSSLNEHLLQGPNLTNSIVGVLIRFRQGKTAFMGDIDGMFLQVCVSPIHHDFLRFLWWPDGNLEGPLAEYSMVVHLFGAAFSPSVANYVLKSTADVVEKEFGSVVAETIRRNFYVDDCLKSVDSAETAIALIRDLRSACQRGGFKITNFCCNDRDVLDSVPKEEQSKELHAGSCSG